MVTSHQSLYGIFFFLMGICAIYLYTRETPEAIIQTPEMRSYIIKNVETQMQQQQLLFFKSGDGSEYFTVIKDNEPYVTGDNPIVTNDKVLFNNMLGTSLGIKSDKYESIRCDTFYITINKTSDCNNHITGHLDHIGNIYKNLYFIMYYFRKNGKNTDYVDIFQIGLMSDVYRTIEQTLFHIVKDEIDKKVRAKILAKDVKSSNLISGIYTASHKINCYPICFAMGSGSVRFDLTYIAAYSPFTDFNTGDKYYIYSWKTKGSIEYFDTFKDPLDFFNKIEQDIEIVGGTPYNYGHKWPNVSGIYQYNRLVKRPE